MTNPDVIQLDSDVLLHVINDLKTSAENLDHAAEEATKAVERMVGEIKDRYGNKVPPVYADLEDVLRKTVQRMTQINKNITTSLRADASTVNNQLEQQTAIQEEGAAAVAGIDANMTAS